MEIKKIVKNIQEIKCLVDETIELNAGLDMLNNVSNELDRKLSDTMFLVEQLVELSEQLTENEDKERELYEKLHAKYGKQSATKKSTKKRSAPGCW